MIIVGNVVLMPTNLLLTLAYIAIIFGGLWIGQREAALMRFGVWSLDQTGAWPWKALGHRRGRKLRESLRRKLVGEMRRAKRERVVAWVKNDEVSLFGCRFSHFAELLCPFLHDFRSLHSFR
jgi:hypothetical protein